MIYNNQLKNVLCVVFSILALTIINGQSGHNGSASPADSTLLYMASDDKGLVIPQMDSLGRTLITTPAQGLMIYQMDKQAGFYYYTGTTWNRVGNETNQNEGSRMVTPGVGIGTTTPDNSLQIVGGDNATLSSGTGYMTLGNIANTNMVLDNNGIQVRNNSAAGNLRLQENGGNVYIDNPDATLYVRGIEDISLTDDEGLAVLGPTTGLNIAIDNNEIMARNNGNSSTLYLQNDGGDTNIGGNLQLDKLLKGRTILEENIITLSTSPGILEVGNFTYIEVAAVENPTPSVSAISGYSTAGRILILHNYDWTTDWTLVENAVLNLPSATVTMNGRDVIFLISDGVAYHQLAFSSN